MDVSREKMKIDKKEMKGNRKKNTIREKRREGKEKLEMWWSGQRQRYCDDITYTERGMGVWV